MINPKELRIGNAVTVTPHGQNNLMILSQKDYENLIIFDTYDRINPIPLTPEILEKCGFIHSTYEWYLQDSGFVLEYSDLNNGWHYTGGEGLKFGVACQSVHQLQNLYFALTGQELTINL